MSRHYTVAAAQLAPIACDEPRASAVARMVQMMREAHLDRCREIRENIFNFALHREPGDYAPICAPKE